MKLSQLTTALRAMLDDEAEPYLWDDDTLARYLNNAVREACLRARLLKDDAYTQPTLCEYAITAGNAYINIDPSVLVPRSGTIVGEYHKLWALTADSLDKLHCNWESDMAQAGTPRFMVMDLTQKTLRLWPTPAVDGVLRLRVWRQPLDAELMVTPDDVPVVQLPDPEELKHWGAYEAYLKNDIETYNPGSAAEHLAIFEQRFGARPSLHDMARWADSPPRVRRAHMF